VLDKSSVPMSIKLQSEPYLRLGDRLVASGLITQDQLRIALERQKQTGEFLGEIVVSLGFAPASAVGKELEDATGFPYVDLGDQPVDLTVARQVQESIARTRKALPFKEDNGAVYIAMADPLDLVTADQFKGVFRKRVVPCLAFAFDVEEGVKRVFDIWHKAQTVLEEIPENRYARYDESLEALIGQAQHAPIVRLVNGIVHGALVSSASDIHIEPMETDVRVRYRIDGLLYDQMMIPTGHLSAVISRLKIMSNMDIAERRRPQDGRFGTKDDAGSDYDVRLSIMPTIYGEKAVMRLLEKSGSHISIEKLGFFPEQLAAFRKFIHRPHGIVLVTGPTGSGKSTTLFCGLQQINDTTLNINTVEDPVEYKLRGVNQMQVNPKIGVTFATGLRTLVRQDPDVILVGEIRDFETAEISIQAALTGHLVFSTLHTNDAPGAVVRLQNMGVEPFLISSAVVGVLGQRLLRTICPSCKEVYTASDEVIEALGIPDSVPRPIKMARGRGCRRCGHRGMKGRLACYEVMPITDAIRTLLLRRASSSEIADVARKEGMITMQEAGLRRVLSLEVSPEEMTRVLAEQD